MDGSLEEILEGIGLMDGHCDHGWAWGEHLGRIMEGIEVMERLEVSCTKVLSCTSVATCYLV